MLDQALTGPLNGFMPGPRSTDHHLVADNERFTLRPISPTIGSVIEGVSLAEPLDSELKNLLNTALIDRKVLLFRDQDLTPEQHRDFAANWGSLESHPFFNVITADQTAADVVRLEKNKQTVGLENVWHSDVSWRNSPSMGAVLRAVEVPAVGGDTLWCDMEAAYASLSVELQAKLEGMTAVHDWISSFGASMSPAEQDALRPSFPPAEHPIVRTHPETSRKILYVNRIFTDHIEGMSRDQSDELLDFLYLQANMPEYQARWSWQAGDVAFWDNRSTQHYATSDYHPGRRTMERISIVGDKPI